jgi:hypothetical protein
MSYSAAAYLDMDNILKTWNAMNLSAKIPSEVQDLMKSMPFVETNPCSEIFLIDEATTKRYQDATSPERRLKAEIKRLRRLEQKGNRQAVLQRTIYENQLKALQTKGREDDFKRRTAEASERRKKKKLIESDPDWGSF